MNQCSWYLGPNDEDRCPLPADARLVIEDGEGGLEEVNACAKHIVDYEADYEVVEMLP